VRFFLTQSIFNSKNCIFDIINTRTSWNGTLAIVVICFQKIVSLIL